MKNTSLEEHELKQRATRYVRAYFILHFFFLWRDISSICVLNLSYHHFKAGILFHLYLLKLRICPFNADNITERQYNSCH